MFLEKIKKENFDAVLLPSSDEFSHQHFENSPLHKITGFSGTAGEAVILKDGEILLFIDPRYHIEAQNNAKPGVKVIKMQMRETFLDTLPKFLDKNARLLLDEKFITLRAFEKIKKVFKNAEAQDFFPSLKYSQSKIFKVSENNIEKLKNKLKKYEHTAILVTDLDDIACLTGLRSFDIPYSAAFRAKLLIRENENILYTDEKIPFNFKAKPLVEFKELKGKVIVFEGGLNLSDFKKIEMPIVLKQNPVAKMAAIKTNQEIELLKESFKKVDTALFEFRKKIKEGLSEFELKEMLERELFRSGACALSFKTILSIGENTASIHYSSWDKNKFLKKGDLILADCGIYDKCGLATDITRVFVCGKPKEEQKEIYTLVLKAFFNAYHSNLQSGFELDELARKILKNAPKDFLFSHALGHGIGVNVHSLLPSISPSGKKTQKLKKNMAFTIEPGLYREGAFGIRLENTVYLDKNNKKVSLSKFPFEDDLIKKELLTSDEKKWLELWQNGEI